MVFSKEHVANMSKSRLSPLVVNGVRYASVREAVEKTKCTREQMLSNGFSIDDNFLPRTGLYTLAKNIRTNEIIKFKSIAECARHFNVTEIIMGNHLKSNKFGTFEKDDHVFKLDNEKPWPSLMYHANLLKLGNIVKDSVLAKNLDNGVIITFESVASCCRYFKIPESTMFLHLKSDKVGSMSKMNFVFKYNDNSDWPKINIDNIVSFGLLRRGIVVTNCETNKSVQYPSITEYSTLVNIDRRAIRKYVDTGSILKTISGDFLICEVS